MRRLILENLKVYYESAESRKDNHRLSRIKFSLIKTNYLTRLMKR